jgi:hypothetical protein
VSSFCPDGYVATSDAILKAISTWHAEQIAALETPTVTDSPGGVDAQGTPPSQPPIISSEMQQVMADMVMKTTHRLRNLLYEGRLSAYYFGGLFSSGRSSVPSEFWATEEANGVLESGSYFPFGRPSRSFEQRPSYPLFLLKAELDEVLSEQQPTAKKSPLPKAKMPELVAALRELDHLPNRPTQFKAVRDLPKFQSYHLTDELFRKAAKKVPRRPGRRRNQKLD